MRIFKCKKCHHRLRYGQKVCSLCYAPSPAANRSWFLLTLLAVMVGLTSCLFPYFYSAFGVRVDMIPPDSLLWRTMAV